MENQAEENGIATMQDDNLAVKAVRIPEIKDSCIFYLNGFVDTYNSNFLQTQVHRLIEYGFVHIIFECSNLNYISSTGVGSFTEFTKRLQEKNGNFVIVNPQPKVVEVFKLLGFYGFFTFKETVQQAIAYIKDPTGTHVQASPATKPFPKIVLCGACKKKLKVSKPAKYRCPGCQAILIVK